jgi:hypothetical protein
VLCVGRYGKSSSYRTAQGEVVNLAVPRYVVQIDQFFTLDKSLRIEAKANDIIERCRQLGVPMGMLALDSTGTGHGLVDLLLERGHPVLPVAWGSAATHRR